MTSATVCTIAALNYLPRVRVLHRSLRRTNPDVRFVVLIVDDVDGAGAIEPFETIWAADVIDSRELAAREHGPAVHGCAVHMLRHVPFRCKGSAKFLELV